MGRQKREKQAHRSGLVVGRISITRRGYGFVDAPEGNIYVSERDTAGAMHGDTVAVRPQARRGKEGRRGIGRSRSSSARRRRSWAASSATAPSASSSPPTAASRTEVIVGAREAAEARSGDIVVTRHHRLSHAASSRAGVRRGGSRQGGRSGHRARDHHPGARPCHGVPRERAGRGGEDRAGHRSRGAGRPRGPARGVHVHDRPRRCPRLRRRDLDRARGRQDPARRSHRRRESLRAVGERDRRGGAATYDERVPRRPRAADASRGALERHLLAQARTRTASHSRW